MKGNQLAVIVVIVLIVGVLGYLGKHQLKTLLMGTPSQPTASTEASTPPTSNPSPSSSSAMVNNAIVMTKTDPTKGDYLTDPKGMTLYTFDKDTNGTSSCYGGCAKTWPPYLESSTPNNLPENVGATKRTDGTTQYTWKNMPLYYYATDQKPGDITGDGVNGVWHIIKP